MINNWRPGSELGPGIWLDVPEKEYRAYPAKNNSTIVHALDRPNKCVEKTKGTPDQYLGRVAHLRLLQPKEYEKNVFVCPNQYTSAEAKTWKKQVKRSNPDALIISEEWKSVLDRMAYSWEHGTYSKRLQKLLKGALIEVVFIWYEKFFDGLGKEHNVLCKMKADIVKKVGNVAVLADLKTTKDALPEHFSSEIAKRKYHFQLAFYRRGIKALFPDAQVYAMLIAIEKTGRCDFIPHEFKEEDGDLDDGDELVNEAMQTVLDCERKNEWPAFVRRKATYITRSGWDKRRTTT